MVLDGIAGRCGGEGPGAGGGGSGGGEAEVEKRGASSLRAAGALGHASRRLEHYSEATPASRLH